MGDLDMDNPLQNGKSPIRSESSDVQKIIDLAEAKIESWKAQGKTREELLREFAQKILPL
jgi:hypothetical protein